MRGRQLFSGLRRARTRTRRRVGAIRLPCLSGFIRGLDPAV